jgi:hypothetical protein
MITAKTIRRSRSLSQATSRLKGILSQAKFYQWDSSRVTSEFSGLKEEFRLPNREWSFLEGYLSAINDGWYATDLTYGSVVDGVPLVGKWDTLTQNQRDTVSSGADAGHWWTNKDGSTGKPFFVSRRSQQDPSGFKVVTGLYA